MLFLKPIPGASSVTCTNIARLQVQVPRAACCRQLRKSLTCYGSLMAPDKRRGKSITRTLPHHNSLLIRFVFCFCFFFFCKCRYWHCYGQFPQLGLDSSCTTQGKICLFPGEFGHCVLTLLHEAQPRAQQQCLQHTPSHSAGCELHQCGALQAAAEVTANL